MKRFFLIFAGVLFGCMVYTLVFAAEVENLVNKLVEKKVLTTPEAQILLEETKVNVAKETVKGEADTLPEWIKTIKLKGDLRLRYQDEEKDTISSGTTTMSKRERARFRFRLGAEARVADDWKVNFGLASGSTDPRSTNQTFQDNFSTKGINLDYAYGIYAVFSGMDIVAGKMSFKKCLWPDFLPDSDFLGGITDAKGYELILEYGLAKNVSLGIDYYKTETIKAASKQEQNLIQLDVVMKF